MTVYVASIYASGVYYELVVPVASGVYATGIYEDEVVVPFAAGVYATGIYESD